MAQAQQAKKRSDSETNVLQMLKTQFAQGELGRILPVVLGLIVIWAVFYYLNPNFLSSRNLSNLIVQIVQLATLGAGVVLVLLLGEIDLSIGAVTGVSAGVMAVLSVNYGWGAFSAIGAAVLVGALIGAFQGTWIALTRTPSFIVTLAGLLGFQGLLLYLLGDTGTININDPQILAIASYFLPPVVSWAIAGAVALAYTANLLLTRRARLSAGLDTASRAQVAVYAGLVALTAGGLVFLLNAYRGVPLAGFLLLGFVILLAYVTKRTRFGRYIFAIGGNAEAARRAGINVTAVRIIVFTIASMMAAIGGVIAASRAFSVSPASANPDLTLLAIATAVIGGTSLFGGRGTVWAALLGALVIGSLESGMDLLNAGTDVKFMVQGSVLLLAVTADALSRRRRTVE